MVKAKTSQLLIILSFIAIYFVWGTTYLANLYGLEGMKPFVLSSLRYLTAGTVLLLYARFKKLSFPDKGSVKALVISGVLMLVGGSGMVVFAEQYVTSGHAAVVIATEPLWFVLLDRKGWKLYFSNFWIIAGLLAGFAGIILFSHFTPSAMPSAGVASQKLTGTVIVVVSAIMWVIGTLYAKRNTKPATSNLVNSSIQLLAAGLVSVCIAFLLQEWSFFHPEHISAKAWGGLLFLIVMGSLVAFMAFTWLVTVQPPAIVSTHTYINPIVAIFIGWMLAGEQINLLQILSLVLVLAGILLTNMKRKPA